MLISQGKIAPDIYQGLVDCFERLAISAGSQIMAVRDAGVKAELKADLSPVTEADRRAETVILDGLDKKYPDIPVIAEEQVAAGQVPDIGSGAFILVDPLDGTREFVAGKTDFTVNIALVVGAEPVAGVVYAPARNRIWSGCHNKAEAANVMDGVIVDRKIICCTPCPSVPRIVVSRSHRTAQTDAFIARLGECETVSVGSSLKFCLLAEGSADLYPRFGRTMEWDTAAGDAVLRAAGGKTVNPDMTPFSYGKRNQGDDEDFANGAFIAFSPSAGHLL